MNEKSKQKSGQEHRNENDKSIKRKSEHENSKSENSQKEESFTEALNRRDSLKTKRDTGAGTHEAAEAEGRAEKKTKTEIDGVKQSIQHVR